MSKENMKNVNIKKMSDVILNYSKAIILAADNKILDEIDKKYFNRMIKEIKKNVYAVSTAHRNEHLNRLAYEATAYMREISESMRSDVRELYKRDPAVKSYEEVVFCYPYVTAMILYRIAHILYIENVSILPRILTEYAHSITGIDIHPGAEIGNAFFIDHGTGIVIGETTIIGDNVTIYQGVTLGAYSFKKDGDGNFIYKEKRHPTVGNNVIIYANATILGGDTVVGDNAIIGSNSWISSYIEKGTVVKANSVI